MELGEFQREAARTDQRPGNAESDLALPLLGLASEVGGLVNQYKKRVRDGEAHALFTERTAEELGDVLWYVANLSTKLGISLEDVAAENLRRTRERWPTDGGTQPVGLLDDAFPHDEQLPRDISVAFVQVTENGKPRVRLYSDDLQLGSTLSDMAWEDDAYRFHDAFHLTYAALLGWSPITRTFFARKRESNPEVREIEDSGRAKVIEEAIAVLAFEYARAESFLEGVQHVDFSLLQMIRDMVSRLEVRVRTAHEWERAILKSFEMWRSLRANSGGTLRLNLPNREIAYEPPVPP